MSYTHIYKKTEEFVVDLFRNNYKAELALHNLDHTTGVVKRVNEIAGHYHLTEDETLILFVAAWFHDTGYLLESRDKHEFKSVDLMREFMKEFNLSNEIVDKMEGCIMATRMLRDPGNQLEEILSDADTYQFGSKKDFKISNKLAFAEAQHHIGVPIGRKHFDEGTLKMLGEHQFYTSYCRENLDDQKKEIMKKIDKKIKEEKIKEEKMDDEKIKDEKRKDDQSKDDDVEEITEKQGTTKGMQTMLRLTSSNHIQLSEMADNKANILISVNAIIISVILSVLLRKLSSDPYLTIPTMIFLSFSVITIVIAILATRPKVSTGKFEDEDVINKKTNLLFFGNFHRMTHPQYEGAMRSMMKDSDYLYSSIIQDIFHLGQVLGKKYKLIRLAYNVFMIGIVISVIAFSISSILHKGSAEGVVPNGSGSPF